MAPSPAPAINSTQLKVSPLSLRATVLGALLVFTLSAGVTVAWRALGWPGYLFASPLAFFLMMGAFFAWTSLRLRARPWYMKVGVALLYGLPGGLLAGWLGTVLLH